jgi:hypothetical protein
MSHDAENLLEVDRIDEVLEAADPPQPVVVVQYARKGLPWFWIMALIILTPIGGMLIYHRVVVEHLRSQTLDAKRELASWKERIRIEAEREALPAERPGPRSSTSQPAVPTPVNTEPSHVQVSATSDSGTRKESPVTRPADVTTERGRSPSIEGGVVGDTESTASRATFTGDSPAHDLEPAPPVPGSPAVATAPAQAPKPLIEAPPPAAIGPAGPSLDAAPAAAPPSPPIAVRAEPPLPSKEETLRAIQEEAIRHQVEDKAVEIHRLRYEERIRFHQDLRQVLDQHGRHAGPAIDQLCVRYGFEADRIRVARGSRIWSSRGKPLAARVWQIRGLDLPETAILNFMSDDLHARLHTPDGPRDSNEVRVKAARLLLHCELPPFDELVRSLAAGEPGATDANRRPANPSSKATAVAPAR